MNSLIRSFGKHRTGHRFRQFDASYSFHCHTTHWIFRVVNAARRLITPEMQSLSAFERFILLTGKSASRRSGSFKQHLPVNLITRQLQRIRLC